jgi:integrase
VPPPPVEHVRLSGNGPYFVASSASDESPPWRGSMSIPMRPSQLPANLRHRGLLFAALVPAVLTYSEKKLRNTRNVKSRMKLLLELFGDTAAAELTGKMIDAKLADNGWSASTRNHYRALVSLAYRLGIHDGAVEHNPARDSEHSKEDNLRVRYLSDVEDKKLREVIFAHWPERIPEFDFAISTGLRKGSQYGLTWSMIDFETRMMSLPTSKTTPLHLPLNAAAVAALRIVRSRGKGTGRVFECRNSRHWFDKAVKLAGIEGFHWHDLRHTFASRLRMAGTPIENIAQLLGHSTRTGISMTMRYAHLAPSQLHAEVARLDAQNSTILASREEKTDSSLPVSYVN